jgi:toxin CcdB
MAQFDVFVNPILAARRGYPFVVAMQSEFATHADDQIVAPLILRSLMPNIAGHLTPIVALGGTEHIVLVPRLSVVRRGDLTERFASIAAARKDLLAAIDYLFFGV